MILDVFADESSQNDHDYMVLGGVILDSETCPAILSSLQQIRITHNLHKELKWGKVSAAKLDAYKAILDCFFAHNIKDEIHFHSLIIDTRRLNHKKYNQGNREIGFSKFIYQLLIKFGRIYYPNGSLHVHLDKRTTRQSLDELRLILNNGIRKRWNVPTQPFKRVQFIDSKKSDFVQITDLLIGSIAYFKNCYHLNPNASYARLDLHNYMMEKAGLADLRSTPRTQRRFTIWNFVPGE